ncbi:hypothetical protein MP228_011914 [Amoeboaphelidium protococcarum]|nr:hypothetical protein MP228_011914 [Amoeboaphelidium protococcarum]
MPVSEDQVTEYKEAFSLFDKKGNGTIEAGSLGDLLRSLNQNPTQSRLNELVQQFGGDKASLVNFDQFLALVTSGEEFKPSGTLEEFISAFQVFDKESNGSISSGELRYVLTSLGEKLSDAEVDELLKCVEVDKSGFVNYETFCKTILGA